MAKKTPLAERLDAVREKIDAACARAKRASSEVTLVAVTKYAPPEAVREIVQLGVTDLGESRVPQLVQRASQINEFHARRSAGSESEPFKPLRWHMIGHLQRNKVKALLPVVQFVHSIDSLRLAEEIDIAAAKLGRKIPVMLQVNASEEPQKYGIAVGAATHLGEQIATMENVKLVGLMTMAALGATEAQTRRVFIRTYEILVEMKRLKISGTNLRHLSMGMSEDYEWAIEEGATMVRLGSSLFGPKPEGAAEDED